MNDSHNLAGQKIGIYGKGGAGKSTVTVLLARVLQSYGYTTCVLDADSTNVGVAQALGIEREPHPLIDHFGGWVFSGGSVTCPVDDPAPLPCADIDVAQLPQDYVATTGDGITLLTGGKITGRGPGAGCDGPVVKIARDLRFQIGDVQPVTLIDFKAGFEDTARGTITGIDWGVVVVDPSTASIDLAKQMKAVVDQMWSGAMPQTAHLEYNDQVELARRIYRESAIRGLAYVLNRIPNRDTADYLREVLGTSGIEPSAVFLDDTELAACWLRGAPVDVSGHWAEGLQLIRCLEARMEGQSESGKTETAVRTLH
jgi:CO dehydrogenase nickel-insertion accessory protein CooC1